jgi:hypothetical protein
MENRWIKAATILRPTVKVCGVRLLPFCLRHRVALESIGSPVLATDKVVTPEHLLAAVRILSTHDINDVATRPTLRELVWAYRLNNKKTLMRETYKVLVYMNEQSLWPRFWSKDENQNDIGAIPWPLAVVASLTRNGSTLKDAWTMPESEAIWLHIAHCASTGASISVVSDYEWDAMESFKAKAAAAEAAKAETQSTRN